MARACSEIEQLDVTEKEVSRHAIDNGGHVT